MRLDGIIKIFKDKKNERFLICAHQNLEGDAIGSQLALAELLKALGKQLILIAPEEIPETYRFLAGTNKIHYMTGDIKIDYDVACIVDCTGLDRLGPARKYIDHKKPIINIDHHVSNSRFGDVRWIAKDVSCTGEQIYHLFKAMKVPLTKRAALYIYIAMLTDTGSFRYSNTQAKTHEIVAELMIKGIDPTDLYRRIYEGTKKSQLSLLSSVLSTLNTTRDGRISWLSVTKEMLKKHKTKISGTEDFVNFPRSIHGVRIALAFREVGRDIVKVSLRSNYNVDVCKLAKLFGGGGHPTASGCTLRGSISEIEEAVLRKAKKYLKNYKL